MPGEQSTDLRDVGAHVRDELIGVPRARRPARCTWRSSPGTYLVANAGAVVATCIDVVDTGRDGYLFAKLDTGMTEVTRPVALRRAASDRRAGRAAARGRRRLRRAVLRVGRHPDARARRSRGAGAARVPRPQIGDLVIVGGAGAYCAAMSRISPARATTAARSATGVVRQRRNAARRGRGVRRPRCRVSASNARTVSPVAGLIVAMGMTRRVVPSGVILVVAVEHAAEHAEHAAFLTTRATGARRRRR